MVGIKLKKKDLSKIKRKKIKKDALNFQGSRDMDKISLSKFRRLLNKRMLQARFKPVKSFGIRPKCLTEGRGNQEGGQKLSKFA